MEKITKVIIFSILGIIGLVAIILLLQNLQVDSVSNLKLGGRGNLIAGVGETCSTLSFKINCSQGLTCATKKNISDFNPNLETARCIPTKDVIDLNSSIWKK